MRHALSFGLVAGGCLLAAVWLPWWPIQGLLGWVAISMGLVSAAYAGVGPAFLGKGAEGELPSWSFLLNGPFLLFALASMRLWHRAAGHDAFHEVDEGLWLGRRPSGRDRKAYAALGVRAVVDLCAELPRSRVFGDEPYLTLPVLDGDAPTTDQLREAVHWIDVHLSEGPVFVHCALGYSRSATAVAAWRMSHGDPAAIDALERSLRATREGVWFTKAQRRALERWRLALSETATPRLGSPQ